MGTKAPQPAKQNRENFFATDGHTNTPLVERLWPSTPLPMLGSVLVPVRRKSCSLVVPVPGPTAFPPS